MGDKHMGAVRSLGEMLTVNKRAFFQSKAESLSGRSPRIYKVANTPRIWKVAAHSKKALGQFVSSEEVSDFERRGLFRIRTMNRVLLNGAGKFLADRAFLGICGIGGAHQLP